MAGEQQIRLSDAEIDLLDTLLPDAVELASRVRGARFDEATTQRLLGIMIGTAYEHSGKVAPQNGQANAEFEVPQVDITDRKPTPPPPEVKTEEELPLAELDRNGYKTKDGFMIVPGGQYNLMINPKEIPLSRAKREDDPEASYIPGILARVHPVLGYVRTSVIDPNAPKRAQVGPELIVSDLGRMRYEDAQAILAETAEELARRHENTGNEDVHEFRDRKEHFQRELAKERFKIVVSTSEALDAGDWNEENSVLLYSNDSDKIAAIYPYVVPAESATPGELKLIFGTEGLVPNEVGKCMPLGTIALSGNVVIVQPYDEVSMAGSQDFPRLHLESPLDRVDDSLLAHIADRLEMVSKRTANYRESDDMKPPKEEATEPDIDMTELAADLPYRPPSIIPDQPLDRGRGRREKKRVKEPIRLEHAREHLNGSHD